MLESQRMQVVSEYGRQRDYLERTVESLKRKLAKDAEKSRADNMRIMAEHVALVQEINELRREIKVLRDGDATPNTGDMRAMSETDAFNALRSAVEARRRQVGRLRMQPL